MKMRFAEYSLIGIVNADKQSSSAPFLGTNEIEFSENIVLNNTDSEVAVYSTIYHCGSDHKTPCYIQGFKGKTLRSTKQANSERKLDFHIAGWMK